MRSCTILVSILLFITSPSFTQPERIERYQHLLAAKQQLNGFKQDTAYISLLVRLAECYNSIDVDSQLVYSQKAYEYAEKIHYVKGEAESLRSIGDYYDARGDYAQMLSYRQQALSLAETTDDKILIVSILLNIGKFYISSGNDSGALQHFTKAYAMSKEAGDSVAMAYVLTSIAAVYYQRNDYDKALQYYRQALQVAEGLPGPYTAAFVRVDIGGTLCEQGHYKEALGYFLPSMQYYRLTKDKLGIIHTTLCLATAYSGLGMPDKALPFALESFSLAKETGNKPELSEASAFLAGLYEKRKDYFNSLTYFKLYKAISDSLFNEDTRKKTFELETKYTYEKKETLLKAEHARENSLQGSQLKNLRLEILVSAVSIIFLGLLVIVLYRSRSVKEKNNRQLEAKNLEISSQKEQIEKQAEQLQQGNRQKDHLFSIIAHDLRGPLNSLKTLLDFLKEKSLSEVEIAKTINSLKNNVDYTADLVNNLLYWARNQMNGIRVEASVLQVEPLAGGILNLFVKQATDKKIQLENKLDKQFTIYADKDMIQLVLRNTVSNAIKFCRPGDSITIEGGIIADGFAEICVADTGIGIREDVLEKIDRHQSVSTFGTAAEKGTGLGLLLCRQFVEKNGGRFRIMSQWNKGSRICMSLPVHYGSSWNDLPGPVDNSCK